MTGVIVILIIGIALFVMRTRHRFVSGWNPYVIKKGKHYSQKPDSIVRLPFSLSFAPKKLMFSVILADGCRYNTKKLGDDSRDISKIFGVSYGVDPHYNSVRLGMVWDDTIHKFKLYAYTYYRGKRIMDYLMSTDGVAAFDCEIVQSNGVVRMEIIDGAVRASRVITMDNAWVRFILYPYFGGNKPAPNDIKIFIRIL